MAIPTECFIFGGTIFTEIDAWAFVCAADSFSAGRNRKMKRKSGASGTHYPSVLGVTATTGKYIATQESKMI